MAEASSVSPKHRALTEWETFSTYSAWQSRMKAILRKNDHYTRFLIENGQDSSWKTRSDTTECRGLVDDAEGVKTKKEVKLLHLTGMLEEIADWVPFHIQHEVVEESTSLESVWSIICQV